MFVQLTNGDGQHEAERVESAVTESCDITTAPCNLMDAVSGELTAERRRELWRRAHDGAENKEVWKQEAARCHVQTLHNLFDSSCIL